jgi:fimbrial chaperone protein
MRSFGCWLLAGLLVQLCGLPSDAGATSLTVAPTRIDLSADARSGSVTLENTGPTDTTVQVETFAWARNDTTEGLEPTRGLLAVPAVFNLPAGGRQVIRVASRETTSGTIEAAYRLLITEVPTAAPDTPAGIRFALRLSLPVFITPPGAVAEPRWTLRRTRAGGTLEVANEGSAHLHVRRLIVRDKASGRVLADLEQPSYVLARATHGWPDLVPAGAGSVVIEAETNLGGLTVDLDG